ncbi:hypothetical protein WIS52_02340 [Pseudonocardia nematodicida]|uniref:PH domain-containing protein n=1 Tax=Pseudonocardia nematodicida TaxID=1206997 RepID=A0ABV1K663_9PSEU
MSGADVSWSRTLVSRRLLGAGLVALGIAAGLVLLPNEGSPWVAGLLAVLGGWLLLQSRTRVVVDDRGIRVEQPLLRRRLTGAPIDEIEDARSTVLDPTTLAVNGFGVLRSGTTTAFRATRSGEALEAGLTGGRRFLVTVTDSAAAAELLNDVVARNRTRGGNPVDPD